MITIKDILKYEGMLLQIEEKFKFEMPFNDAYRVKYLLSKLGDVTNYLFALQDDFYEKYHDTDKLKKYHDKLMGGHVNASHDLGIDEELLKEMVKDIVTRYGDEIIEKSYSYTQE